MDNDLGQAQATTVTASTVHAVAIGTITSLQFGRTRSAPTVAETRRTGGRELES